MHSNNLVSLAQWKLRSGIDMSVMAMRFVRKVRGLSVGARGLALTLADSFNEDYGYAWPTRKTLADEFGVSVRSIDNWIAELKREGIVQVRHEDGRLNNRYYMPEVEDMLEDRKMEAIANARR